MSHRVRHVEISYDQDGPLVDEDALIKHIERFFCPDYADMEANVPEHDCLLIGISCTTETHLCSNCNTDQPCRSEAT